MIRVEGRIDGVSQDSKSAEVEPRAVEYHVTVENQAQTVRIRYQLAAGDTEQREYARDETITFHGDDWGRVCALVGNCQAQVTAALAADLPHTIGQAQS